MNPYGGGMMAATEKTVEKVATCISGQVRASNGMSYAMGIVRVQIALCTISTTSSMYWMRKPRCI